jgi:hypothetical protein
MEVSDEEQVLVSADHCCFNQLHECLHPLLAASAGALG